MSCPQHCITTPDGVCRQPIAGLPWRQWPECQPIKVPDMPLPLLPSISDWWVALGLAYLIGRVLDWWDE